MKSVKLIPFLYCTFWLLVINGSEYWLSLTYFLVSSILIFIITFPLILGNISKLPHFRWNLMLCVRNARFNAIHSFTFLVSNPMPFFSLDCTSLWDPNVPLGPPGPTNNIFLTISSVNLITPYMFLVEIIIHEKHKFNPICFNFMGFFLNLMNENYNLIKKFKGCV